MSIIFYKYNFYFKYNLLALVQLDTASSIISDLVAASLYSTYNNICIDRKNYKVGWIGTLNYVIYLYKK